MLPATAIRQLRVFIPEPELLSRQSSLVANLCLSVWIMNRKKKKKRKRKKLMNTRVSKQMVEVKRWTRATRPTLAKSSSCSSSSKSQSCTYKCGSLSNKSRALRKPLFGIIITATLTPAAKVRAKSMGRTLPAVIMEACPANHKMSHYCRRKSHSSPSATRKRSIK